jgi:hypothetical protein
MLTYTAPQHSLQLLFVCHAHHVPYRARRGVNQVAVLAYDRAPCAYLSPLLMALYHAHAVFGYLPIVYGNAAASALRACQLRAVSP